jgi:hypothetical protein
MLRTPVLSKDINARLMTAAVFVLIVVGVGLKVVAASPTWIHYDENYYLDISQNYILRGELTPYMWRLGDTNIIAGSGSGYGILILTVWMQMVGVSLWNGRLLMIGIGLLSALVLYFAARWHWRSPLAGVAAAVFAVVATSPFYSMTMRMDSLGMLAYSVVLLIHVVAVKSKSRWLHLAAGAGVIVAAEFHILALIYMGALAFYYGITYLQLLFRERRLVLDAPSVYFGMGALVAGLLYILIHIAPDPRAYFVISEQCHDCSGRSLMKEIQRFAGFAVLRMPELLLFIASLAAALWRREDEDGHYLLLVTGFLLAQAVIGPPPFIHYTYHIWPLIALGCAGLLAHGLKRSGQQAHARQKLAGLAVAVAFLVLNYQFHATDRQPFELLMGVEPRPELAFVRDHVPPETAVMGDVPDYFVLQQFINFLSYRNGDMYGTYLRGETQLEFWQRVQPLVIIGDWRGGDSELDSYMIEMAFAPVFPNVWAAATLREQLDLPVHTDSGAARADS